MHLIYVVPDFFYDLEVAQYTETTQKLLSTTYKSAFCPMMIPDVHTPEKIKKKLKKFSGYFPKKIIMKLTCEAAVTMVLFEFVICYFGC